MKPTKQLVEDFYTNAAKGSDWQTDLADDVQFFAGAKQMFAGKETFAQVYTGVLQSIEKIELKRLFVDGDSACAIVGYDYVPKNGATLHQDTAELWQTNNGKITSFTLFYDEGEYRAFMGQ